jgi:ribonuclease inhibitor
MKNIILDCTGITSRQMLHRQLAASLDFPAYYGENLDALYDCLLDFGADTQLQLLHWEALQLSLGDYARQLELVMQDVHAEESSFTYIFE